MRRLRVELVVVAIALCAASCGDSEPVASAPSTSTPATTLTAVSSTSSTVPSSTVPPTTAAVPTAPPTTTLPVINVEGEPGQPLDVRVKVPTPTSVPDPYRLWMSQTGDSGVVWGYVGAATLENDTLHLVGSIPKVVTHTDSYGRWEPATARATTAGDYKFSLGPATVVIRIARDAPAYVAEVSQPTPLPPGTRR